MQTELKTQPSPLPQPVRITEQTWPKGTVPVVSVFNWAYNHVDFIRKSIESILMQETTFPVEIIIHDDASTDGTIEIIREYEAKHPQLFRNVIHKENQYSQGLSVMEALFAVPKGQLIALTHADDYWTDNHKLQIQADYQATNIGCAGSFHRTRVVDEGGIVVEQDFFTATQDQYNFEDCLTSLSKQYATCSMMIRADTLRNPRPWLRQIPVDMMLELQVALHGTIGYIDRNMADYRKHPAGVWTKLSVREQVLEIIHRYLTLLEDCDLKHSYKQKLISRKNQFSDMLILRSDNKELLRAAVGNAKASLGNLPKQLKGWFKPLL